MEPEDWSDVGAPTPPTLDVIDGACNVAEEIQAHHCFLTTVHAAHLHTGLNPGPNGEGSLFMMHGYHDERLWAIGTTPDAITWHPAVPQTTWGSLRVAGQQCAGVSCCQPGELFCFEEITGWPDVFCSGHVQLADGSLLLGGGNVTGRATGGGLDALYRFVPEMASEPVLPVGGCGFGWQIDGAAQNPLPQMAHDRWYPTLTLLGDGRVLIAGGTSRDFADPADPTGDAKQPPILEVFNPTNQAIGTTPALSIQTLDATNHPDAVFPDQNGMPVGVPNYPFMFVLPNGDVFYAGSEDATLAGPDRTA